MCYYCFKLVKIPGKPETARFLNYWVIFWWPLTLLAISVDLLLIGAGYYLLAGYANIH
jgi:hypothetical protein